VFGVARGVPRYELSVHGIAKTADRLVSKRHSIINCVVVMQDMTDTNTQSKSTGRRGQVAFIVKSHSALKSFLSHLNAREHTHRQRVFLVYRPRSDS
jgi:hypothetical protein